MLYNIPLYEYATIDLSILLLRDIGFFQCLALANCAVVNIFVHLFGFMYAHIFRGHISRSRIAEYGYG